LRLLVPHVALLSVLAAVVVIVLHPTPKTAATWSVVAPVVATAATIATPAAAILVKAAMVWFVSGWVVAWLRVGLAVSVVSAPATLIVKLVVSLVSTVSVPMVVPFPSIFVVIVVTPPATVIATPLLAVIWRPIWRDHHRLLHVATSAPETFLLKFLLSLHFIRSAESTKSSLLLAGKRGTSALLWLSFFYIDASAIYFCDLLVLYEILSDTLILESNKAEASRLARVNIV
jgi:hypothetical protein